jgi:hypothetical protein
MIIATIEGGPRDGEVLALRNKHDYVVIAEMEPITADYFSPENAMREIGFKQRHIRVTHKITKLVDWAVDRQGNYIPPLYVGYYALIWED